MEPNWHTSSYTKSENCVEVADSDPKAIKVRDSKRQAGAIIDVSPGAWGAFVEHVAKSGE
ncbi:hypothetical protein B1H19_13550 [Streptomyces gilvosporeus]|uniref:DUF397 domain-containing protein n=1 Tax=Streptomyces gilvosporeus TaxID=553510 RepID=A0A1V0U2G1_9ACTN|nr:hypothetical protein B1H19_13550 [Streptomyces gilvosporeus]